MIDPIYRFIFKEIKKESENSMVNKYILNYTKSVNINLDQPLTKIMEIGEILENNLLFSIEVINELEIVLRKNKRLSKEDLTIVFKLFSFYREIVNVEAKSLTSCGSNIANFIDLSTEMVELFSGTIVTHNSTVDLKKVIEGVKYWPEHLTRQRG